MIRKRGSEDACMASIIPVGAARVAGGVDPARYTGPPFLATGGDAGTDLPAAHPEAQRLLGRAGLRAGAAARPRSRRRHLPPGHLPALARPGAVERRLRSEEHTSELQSLMRISYAVFCLKKKNK